MIDANNSNAAPDPRASDVESTEPKPKLTEVRYEHTANFAEVMERVGGTLLISTYQAGKLVVVGVHEHSLAFSFHAFEQVMGLAVSPNRIAVGSRRAIYLLRRAAELGPRIEPPGRYDDCFLTRLAHVTGAIHVHEMAWGNDELWIVNTLFSCLCTLDSDSSFVPRWKPPFISNLAGEDRCHLNGLAMDAGRPRYVTALAEVDTPAGWRPTKAQTGCLIDVDTGQTIARGLAMPHSPRVHEGRIWLLDSGRGRLGIIEADSGKLDTVIELPGYTRGLVFYGPLAFVGLSRIRETSVFGGLPLEERRDQLKCGVAVVDTRTAQIIAQLEFGSGVEEIFDVKLLPGVRLPAVSGPDPQADGTPMLWLAAQPRWLPGVH